MFLHIFLRIRFIPIINDIVQSIVFGFASVTAYFLFDNISWREVTRTDVVSFIISCSTMFLAIIISYHSIADSLCGYKYRYLKPPKGAEYAQKEMESVTK